jgi:Flp pilus assembly protein TadG
MLNHRRAAGRRRSAATLVETGICLGACLLFLLAIYEYGRFVMTEQLLANAAREGARQAVVSTNTMTTAQIQATVTNALGGQQLQGLNIQVCKADPSTGTNLGDWTTAAFGDGIAVQVTANYQPILPTFGFLPNPVSVGATALMRCEAN